MSKYCLYNCDINLQDDAQLPCCPIYNFLQNKLIEQMDHININLVKNYIYNFKSHINIRLFFLKKKIDLCKFPLIIVVSIKWP